MIYPPTVPHAIYKMLMAKVIEFYNWRVINKVDLVTEPYFFYIPEISQFYADLDPRISSEQEVLGPWRIDEILDSCRISTWHNINITEYPHLKDTVTISFENYNQYGAKINSDVIINNDALSINFDKIYAEYLSRKTPEFLMTVAEFDEEFAQNVAQHNKRQADLRDARNFFITQSLKP